MGRYCDGCNEAIYSDMFAIEITVKAPELTAQQVAALGAAIIEGKDPPFKHKQAYDLCGACGEKIGLRERLNQLFDARDAEPETKQQANTGAFTEDELRTMGLRENEHAIVKKG